MRLSLLFIAPVFMLISCQKADEIPFVNILMFQIDFESLEPDGAAIFSFPKTRLDPRHPFPIDLEETPSTPTNPTQVRLIYTPELVPIFEATISDTEIGEVAAPSFKPADELRTIAWRADLPQAFKLHPLSGAFTNVDYALFWEKIKNFELTDRVTHANMKGSLYLYKANRDDTTSWKWILMLAH